MALITQKLKLNMSYLKFKNKFGLVRVKPLALVGDKGIIMKD